MHSHQRAQHGQANSQSLARQNSNAALVIGAFISTSITSPSSPPRASLGPVRSSAKPPLSKLVKYPLCPSTIRCSRYSPPNATRCTSARVELSSPDVYR